MLYVDKHATLMTLIVMLYANSAFHSVLLCGLLMLYRCAPLGRGKGSSSKCDWNLVSYRRHGMPRGLSEIASGSLPWERVYSTYSIVIGEP